MENLSGLTKEEAAKKLSEFGPNEIKEINRVTPFKILLRQVKKNFVVYLLFITAAVSLFLGKPLTSFVIMAVISVVITTGFIQEYKAENAIKALKSLIMQVSRVIRDGKEGEIPSSDIVPEDILILRTGERVPADALILAQNNLKVNEAILTGESDEIEKKEAKEGGSISDENLLFMGTFVVFGSCKARVQHIGMNTKFGKIAGMVSQVEKKYPLQDKVNNISKYMVVVAIVTSTLTGLLLFYRAEDLNASTVSEILILIVALSVSAFPEGFPVVLITTLAAGVGRMARQNAIVNRMSVVETLGEVTVICADKTGTITKGEMTVKKIWADGKIYDVTGVGFEGTGEILSEGKKVDISSDDALNLLLKASILANDSNIERTGENNFYKILGGNTEGSLLILGAKSQIFKENFSQRVEEIPFDSKRKMMSVFHEEGGDTLMFSKGAVESILNRSDLDSDTKKRIEREVNAMTSKSLRVLAFGYKKVQKKEISEEDSLNFLGLVGIEDPPREEVAGAIEICRTAGIKVKMVTGDSEETAKAIAGQIGLTGKVVKGDELEKMTDSELSKIISDIAIFARVQPEHKLRIVNVLKSLGEVVAMTGDGVNDAPALKEAHVGIAMGRNGTDVSRSVADLTLRDDNFATIVVAIKEGRTIFNNIRKFVTYQLSCNLGEIIILFLGVLLAPIFGWFVPVLLALQILFMNLVTDNLPALTLGFNPTSKDIMDEKPRRKTDIVSRPFVKLIIFNGTLMAGIALVALYISFNALGLSEDLSRTTTLVTMIFLDIFSAYNFRSFRYGVLNRSLFVNKYLVLASVISIIATVFVIYSPASLYFETVPLKLENWIIAILAAVFIVFVFDALKFIDKKHRILPET